MSSLAYLYCLAWTLGTYLAVGLMNYILEADADFGFILIVTVHILLPLGLKKVGQ